MSKITAYAAPGPKQPFVKKEFDLGPLAPEDVEVKVEYCGVCHSDLSMLNNDWGFSSYPGVFGHEAIGTVTAIGSAAKGIKVGQKVGVGWTASSCMCCRQCMSGYQHLCPTATPTIAGHLGAFATHVRSHWAWTIPVPEGLSAKDAGPLLCGGITVFNPLVTHAKPTARVGVIGIGGLGHMGLKFANAFGCHVTAFTSGESKFAEAMGFGAHDCVSTKDAEGLKKLSGAFDLIISTVNVPLDWDAIIGALAPNGRLHVVGAVLEPIPVKAFPMIMKQAHLSGSPTGSPIGIADMLDFAARNNVLPQTEHFPMSRINEAFDRLAAGKAKYRIVLDADW